MESHAVDEYQGLVAVATCLDACTKALSALELGTTVLPVRGSRRAAAAADSDSDDDELLPASSRARLPTSAAYRRVQSKHKSVARAADRASQAIRDEMESDPVNPRAPKTDPNIVRLYTDEEIQQAHQLVAATVERQNSALADRLRNGAASGRDQVAALTEMVVQCSDTLRAMAHVIRRSQEHFVARCLGEMRTCEMRSMPLGESIPNAAEQPDATLAAGIARDGGVRTGDGSDGDSSVPGTPRSPASPSVLSDDDSDGEVGVLRAAGASAAAMASSSYPDGADTDLDM